MSMATCCRGTQHWASMVMDVCAGVAGTGPPPNTVNADGEPIYDPLKDIELATQKVL